MTASTDFVVSRADLRRTETRQTQLAALQPGQILIRVDRFAFTANNVTYGAVGEMIGYWNFFPAGDGWGRIPVWGFGDVVESKNPDLPVGERVYGYLPMSTHVVLDAAQITPSGFVDGAAHRAALPPIYNQYTRCAADPLFTSEREPLIALFRPLFATAFLLDDFLAEHKGFGASQLLLSSASSKTALGLAFLHHARGRTVLGLTSAGNAAFVRDTGYYDRVFDYDHLGELASEPTVSVDFAGNGAVLEGIHRHFGDRLRYSSQVGITHWERMSAPADLPGPAPVFFFAPDQLLKRFGEWGAEEFYRRLGEATQRFLATTAWLRVVEGRGPAAVERVYASMVDGRIDPAEGHILSLAAPA